MFNSLEKLLILWVNALLNCKKWPINVSIVYGKPLKLKYPM